MSEHLLKALQTIAGDLITDAVVKVYEPGTTTLISETIYSDSACTTPLANGWTATTGYVDFYLVSPKVVRIGAKQGASPEVFYEDVSVGPVIPADPQPVVYTKIEIPGTLTVSSPGVRHYIEDASDIVFIRAAVGTAPTGASLIVDVKNNGTTVFPGTPANAPTIPDSAFTALSGTPDTVSVPAASYFQIAITQIGSTVAGADLVVTIGTRKN